MKKIFILVSMVVCTVLLQAQTTYLPFTESFEYGTTKWTDGTTGGTSEVTTAESVVGTQSYHLTGTATSSRLTNTFSNSIAATSIMYYVQVAGSNGGVTTISDGTNFLFYGNVNGGNFVVADINGAYAVYPVTTGEWVKVEVKKINYNNNTYDLWINDTLRRANLEFDNSITAVNQIELYNSSTGDEAWWDAIYVGLGEYTYPTASGNIVCLNDFSNIVFTEDVAIDSAGTNVFGTTINVGPISTDTTVMFRHPCFETTMAYNNANTESWSGNMFDITTHNNDLSIYAIDVRDNNVAGPDAVKLYYRKGTYVGNETSNAGWLLLDSVNVPLNGQGVPTFVEFTKNLVIPANETYGIYVCVGKGVQYTTGTGGNQTVINEDMTFTSGAAGPYFSCSLSPRVWNGRIYYKVAEEQVDTTTLTTMFARNNSLHGNMMDITAKNDIIIDSLDVNISGSGWVKVYYRNGTCVGNNTSSTGWTLLDSVTVVAAGTDIPTRVPLSNRLLIPAGELYGLYVCSEGDMEYTNDNGSNDTYIDSNIVLVGEYGGTNAFGCTADRVWNGNIYYTIRNNEEVTFGPQSSLFGGLVRGYCFVAPKDFIIRGAMIPNDVTGDQYIEIVRFSDTLPPLFSSTTNNFTSMGYWAGIPQGCVAPADIYVAKGDYIGVYGRVTGGTSYCNTVSSIDILGEDVPILRSGMQFSLITEQMHDIYSSTSADIGRINLYIEDVIVNGGLDSVLIEVQTPVVNLGADTTICADADITLDAGSFSSYTWSTGSSSQTEMVDSTGAGIGSTDIWITVTDMYGCEANDIITITFEDCTGIEENDMLLSVYPNPSNGQFTISTEGINAELYIEVVSPEGRIVRQMYSNESITGIDLSGEDAGVYYVRIQIEDQVKVINIVLQ